MEKRSSMEISKQKKGEHEMKERFEAEEWENLKFIPVAVFFLVAGADGKVDKKEIEAFATQVGRGTMLKDPLHRELIVDIAGNLEGVLGNVKNLKQAENFVQKSKDTLKAKLSEDEYQRFIASLFVSGIGIARASGGAFLGMGNKVSEEEKTALAKFGIAWDLDPQSISKHFS
jgi:hypothetical protein